MNISVFVDGANFSTCRAESRLRDGDMIAQHGAKAECWVGWRREY